MVAPTARGYARGPQRFGRAEIQASLPRCYGAVSFEPACAPGTKIDITGKHNQATTLWSTHEDDAPHSVHQFFRLAPVARAGVWSFNIRLMKRILGLYCVFLFVDRTAAVFRCPETTFPWSVSIIEGHFPMQQGTGDTCAVRWESPEHRVPEAFETRTASK